MTLNEYERQREARIAANKERLQALGVIEMVQDHLQSGRQVQVDRMHRRPPLPSQGRTATQPSVPLPPRRSGRLQGRTFSYVDCDPQLQAALAMSGSAVTRQARDDDWRRSLYAAQHNAEEYTAEDLAKLGTATRPWTLFVDGYDSCGNRVYDPVRGQTCHQCRQKTMGKRTSCSGCQSLHGVFCGDCLYMRYGEHVEEVQANPDWQCPSCRDICNCSFCRTKKGWPPTGTLYRRAVAEGYASVAHYLLITKQVAPVAPENAPETETETVVHVTPDTPPAAASLPSTPVPPTPMPAMESVAAMSTERTSTRRRLRSPSVLSLGPATPALEEVAPRRISAESLAESAMNMHMHLLREAIEQQSPNKENMPPYSRLRRAAPAEAPLRRSARAAAKKSGLTVVNESQSSLSRVWPVVRSSSRQLANKKRSRIR